MAGLAASGTAKTAMFELTGCPVTADSSGASSAQNRQAAPATIGHVKQVGVGILEYLAGAPVATAMGAPARVLSPTIRVEEGDRVKITLSNTHYFPHTIHLRGTIHPNAMDGVPDITQRAVEPGE